MSYIERISTLGKGSNETESLGKLRCRDGTILLVAIKSAVDPFSSLVIKREREHDPVQALRLP